MHKLKIIYLNDLEIKRSIQKALEAKGFSVKSIPTENPKKTPDLIAMHNDQVFVIEIKTKRDNLEQIAKDNTQLARGLAVTHAEPLGRKNVFSGDISDGVQQLAAYPDSPGVFKLLWLHASGQDEDVQFRQSQGTLYGTTDLIDVGSGTKSSIPCYYFHFNEFFRYRENLDGAIITDSQKGQLCINTFSLKLKEFKTSALVVAFADGICDPDKLEASGEAFIADCDYDRRNENLILSYLKSKYNREHLINIDMQHLSGKIRAPRSDRPW